MEVFFLKIGNLFRKFLDLFRFEDIGDNFAIVVKRALSVHNIKVTYTSVAEYLKSHPDYPSFKSICDFLDDQNIGYYPLRYEESDLKDLNYPFIAHLKESGGKVIFVYSVGKEYVVYADSSRGRKIMDVNGFYKKWDGAVIVMDPAGASEETGYKELRKTEIINSLLLPSLLVVFCATIMYGLLLNKPFSYGIQGGWILILLTAHLLGLVFSVLLLRQELNLKTKFTDKLCHIATNADCDAVTKSKASKIFGSITWADAGTAFFTGGLISLFIAPVINAFNLLLLFSIVALPYPVFSILYQWLKVKKWCPFCLSVQFVIIIEAALAINVIDVSGISLVQVFPILIIFSAVFLAVLLMKFLFLSERERKQFKLESLKFKRDQEVFLYKLRKGNRIEIPENKNALIFGDKQSNVMVSVFLSFHCSACARRFGSILKLIESNNKIKVQLILPPSKDEVSIQFMKAIYTMLHSGKHKQILEELNNWYKTEKAGRSKLVSEIHSEGETEGFDQMIEYNSKLFEKGKVMAVPSVFVNGYPLPPTYILDDLKYQVKTLGNMQTILSEIEV